MADTKSLPEWVIGRAGGRRKYNRARQNNAALRRHEVARLRYEGFPLSRIAEALGVSARTVGRDVHLLKQPLVKCPICNEVYVPPLGAPRPCGYFGQLRKRDAALLRAFEKRSLTGLKPEDFEGLFQ